MTEQDEGGYYLLCDGVVRQGGLVAVPLLLELHVAEEQGGGDDLEHRAQVLLGHTHDLNITVMLNLIVNMGNFQNAM